MALPNRKRILLVEDQVDSRELVELNLEEYAVICASDFDEGLSLAQQQKFDLFILDNWLPGRSGVELCRIIREFDPHTPILFYSAAAYGCDISEAMHAGAQGYLVKPVSFDDFKRTVVQLISSKPKES
jgi:DNA-binding response OmpR family regulator